LDHEATWLIGHTQHITFSEIWEDQGELYVEATLHVPCKFLRREGATAQCTAYGFRGAVPRGAYQPEQQRRVGPDRFLIVENRREAVRILRPPARSLPVLDGQNPCALAPCRTADNSRGAACCRDLQIEIMCTRRQRRLEALVRSRRSPYLCKVERAGDFSIEAEIISACGFLDDDGVACTLHGRSRADGRPAKPDLCSEWPPKNKGLHPGCVFAPRSRRRA
jgi:Fe-S-cluster containining protein